jgi:phosphoribosylformylglycinamidine cyclo-ligase
MEKIGGLERKEMYNIFNMGTGMVIAADKENADKLITYFNDIGEKSYLMGTVTDQEGIEIL